MNALQATATAEPVSARASAEPPRLSGPQVITASLIDAVGTSGCGWSRMQIEILGASWPLEAGWREKLVAEGRTLSAEEVEALYAARKAQRTVEADPAEIPVLPCPWCSKPVQRTEHGGHLKEFCNRRHKTAFNNALTKASIAHSRLLRIPGALQAWAKGGVNPSPDGGGALPRTTEGAGNQDTPSAALDNNLPF